MALLEDLTAALEASQPWVDRYTKLGKKLEDLGASGSHEDIADVNREMVRLEKYRNLYLGLDEVISGLNDVEELTKGESDPEILELASLETEELEDRARALLEKSETVLSSDSEDDARDAWIEIRAGTGGAEAALFVRDLVKMYTRLAERNQWKTSDITLAEAEHGGFKQYCVRVNGDGAYGSLRFEAGIHRVQRVPKTEAQGRIHTSACTVAIFPVVEVSEFEAQIPKDELRIDTFRASGAGGQHVNKTDSAVRITHIPSGVVVECQSDRSQHRNRAQAMAMLVDKLRQEKENEQAAQRSDDRKLMVGSGDRSGKIRTYNFPQSRVTDHRIGFTTHDLLQFLDGDIAEVVEQLRRQRRLEQVQLGQDELVEKDTSS